MTLLRCTFASLLLATSLDAAAGCGSAFCSLGTDWSTQGDWTEPGGRFDLRYEFIDQDQPRTGTRDIGVGEIPHHHDEVRTINRNWIAGFDYTLDAHWGITALLPVVDRSHAHIHNHMGSPEDETWNFTEVGDARLLGRFTFSPAPQGSAGIKFGLKLPTGRHDVANDEGEVAERSLQPGSGTVDGIVGVFYTPPRSSTLNWFADATLVSPLAERAGYKPGTQAAINLGTAYALNPVLSLMLQLNATWKDRDAGTEAEPEDTGGTFVHLSPGVGVSLGAKTRLYGFVQLPIYQYVNGVQLVADWSVAVGVSQRF